MIDKSLLSQPSFCVAPWIHSHVKSDGRRSQCCVSETPAQEEGEESLESFRNGDYMRGLRRSMLDGVTPKECQICEVSNRTQTYREMLNREFSHLYDEIAHLSELDGQTLVPVVYLDYREDVCNLTCRTCNEESSTAWKKWLRKNDLKDVTNCEFDVASVSKKHQIFQEEFDQLIQQPTCESIHFAGGESTLNPLHLIRLQRLVDKGLSKNIELSYNTNLCFKSGFLENWCELLKQFKTVTVSCSIDGIGEINDFVRVGSDWSEVEKNFKHLASLECPSIQILIDPTITSLFFLDIRAFCQFAIDHEIRVYPKVMQHSPITGGSFRVEFLPIEIRKVFYEDWVEFFESLDSTQKVIVDHLDVSLKMALQLPEFSKEENLFHFRVCQEIDKRMSEQTFGSYMESHPVTSAWWRKFFAETQVAAETN